MAAPGRNLNVFIQFAANGVQQTVGQVRGLGSQISQFGGGVGVVTGGVADLAFKFNNVVQAVQTLKASAVPAYEALIGANERLNQQLLSSQANIASSTRIFQGGQEITDPLEKVRATRDELKASLKQLEKDTQSLVGVTSAQVNEVFQILLQNAGQLNNQSKQFPDALAAATSQAKGFVATLGTLGVPLDQARQEINSIYQGQITSDSMLAKSLGLTNEMVNNWKAQGVLVDELNKRFDVYVAANAEASKSIGGITSNIQDVFEVITREAGEPLLEPLVEALGQFYDFLQANQGTITSTLGEWVQKFLALADRVGDAALRIGTALMPGLQELGEAGGNVGDMLIEGFSGLAELIARVIEFLAPLINGIARTVNIATQLLQLSQEGWARITGGYQQATEAAEAYRNVTESLSNEAIASQQDLKAAIDARAEAEANGVGVTEDQAKAEERAKDIAKQRLEAMKAHRQELQQALIVGKENKENIQRQIAEMDAMIERLEEMNGKLKGDGIKLQAKDLETLGNTYQQLEKKAANASRVLAEGAGGDINKAKQAAKDLIDVTNQQRELGKISAEEAIKRLESIAKNSKLSYEEQQAAEKAITAIKEKELKQRRDAIQANISEIEGLVESGQMDEIEGEKKITALKKEELEARLKAVREALEKERAAGRGNSDRAKDLINEEKKIQAEINKERTAAADRLARLQEKKLEREQQKARDAIKATDLEREKALNQAILRGEIAQYQAEQKKLDAARDRIQQEIELERKKAAELAKLPATTPEQIAEKERKIRESKLKTAELENQLIQNRIAKEEALVRRAQELIQRQIKQSQLKSQIAIQGLEKELKAQQMIEESLNRQKQLQDARAAVAKAASDLDQTQSQIELERVTRAAEIQRQLADEQNQNSLEGAALQQELAELGIGAETTVVELIQRKQAIEDQLAEQKLAALKSEQAQQRASLELDIQRNRIQAERLVLQARQNEMQAKQSKLEAQLQLQSAQKIRDPDQRAAEVAAAQLRLKLAEEALKLSLEEGKNASANLGIQNELARNQREALNLQQEQALDRANATESTREQGQNLEIAKVKQEQLNQAIQAQSEELQKSLDKQRQIADSRAALAKAQSDIAQSGTQSEIDRLNRAMDIQKQLASGQVESAEVRRVLEDELKALGIKDGETTLSLLQQRQEMENVLAKQRMEALLSEQAQQRANLEIDIQRNQLQTRRLALVAEQNKLEAERALQDALLSRDAKRISLAERGLQLAKEQAASTQEEIQFQEELATNQRQTLQIQQQQALTQAQISERARNQAQRLEFAQARAQTQATQLQKTQSQQSQKQAGVAPDIPNSVIQEQVSKISNGNIVMPPSPPSKEEKGQLQELRGLRSDIRGLSGVMANRQSTTVNNFNSGGARSSFSANDLAKTQAESLNI